MCETEADTSRPSPTSEAGSESASSRAAAAFAAVAVASVAAETTAGRVAAVAREARRGCNASLAGARESSSAESEKTASEPPSKRACSDLSLARSTGHCASSSSCSHSAGSVRARSSPPSCSLTHPSNVRAAPMREAAMALPDERAADSAAARDSRAIWRSLGRAPSSLGRKSDSAISSASSPSLPASAFPRSNASPTCPLKPPPGAAALAPLTTGVEKTDPLSPPVCTRRAREKPTSSYLSVPASRMVRHSRGSRCKSAAAAAAAAGDITGVGVWGC
mmetsp:Transcript_8835/g.22525  ORF Transcript_8835/g.22525 Transcript_8835/m.22525 type:complete len:278 (+) Transcript_8835:424-1257(+)